MYPSGFACPALLDVWVGLVSPLLFPSVYFALDRFVSGCGGVCRLFPWCCIWFCLFPLIQCPRVCLSAGQPSQGFGLLLCPSARGGFVPSWAAFACSSVYTLVSFLCVSLGSCLRAWSGLRSGVGSSFVRVSVPVRGF